MTATIGTSTNTNNTADVLAAIGVDSTTAVTLLSALDTPRDPPRIKVIIHNFGNRDLWVRFYPSSDDNIKRGVVVAGGETRTVLEGSDIYTGEISAIMDSGGARDVFVTWF